MDMIKVKESLKKREENESKFVDLFSEISALIKKYDLDCVDAINVLLVNCIWLYEHNFGHELVDDYRCYGYLTHKLFHAIDAQQKSMD